MLLAVWIACLPLHAAQQGECVELSGVTVGANALLGDEDAQALVDPFLGDCISADLVRALLKAFSDFFIERGYVTTRPYLQEQDIGDGEIEIEILPGVVEAVIDARSGERNWRIASAFAFNGPVLDLRELESSLEILERPRSVQASFEIQPGGQPGGSVVVIETRQQSPLQVELGANARSEVDPQLSVAVTLDNLLNLNDILEFRYNSGDIYQAYQSDRSREWQYSAPLGRYLLTYVHSDIAYRQRLQGSTGSFLSEGDSVSDRLQLDRRLLRGQSWRLEAGIALELEDSSNQFEGEEIEVSSYRTSKAELDIRHDWFAGWGQLYSRYAYQRGLDSFGARDDDFVAAEETEDTEATLQFARHTLELRGLVDLPDPRWSLRAGFLWQYTADTLYDADKLILGSESTVRGYNSALSGSNGWYARSDLVRRLQSVTPGSGAIARVKSISLSLGLDYGEVRCEGDNPDVCGDIYGLGAGLVLADDNFNALLSWGHPLVERADGVGDEDLFLLDFRWRI